MYRIDVLMAVHNGEQYLLESMTSVIQQTGVRLVIVDDGSTDGTSKFIRDAQVVLDPDPRRIVALRTEARNGLTRSLILGMRYCNAPYIARQDADDLSHPERFQIQIDYLESHPEVVAVSCRAKLINEEGREIRKARRARWCPILQLWLWRNPVVHGGLVMRREAINMAGGYQETFEQSQDVDLLFRMRKIGKVRILPDVLYSLRVHDRSVTKTMAAKQAAFAQLARWANL